jgi:hypothetical protein
MPRGTNRHPHRAFGRTNATKLTPRFLKNCHVPAMRMETRRLLRVDRAPSLARGACSFAAFGRSRQLIYFLAASCDWPLLHRPCGVRLCRPLVPRRQTAGYGNTDASRCEL